MAQLIQTNAADAFSKRQTFLSNELRNRDRFGNLDWYCNAINPEAKSVSQAELATQERLQQILSTTITNVVDAYFTDRRLQKLFNFSEHLHECLQQLQQKRYKIGTYRPDFLFDTSGDIVVCEINARFPCNGYLMTNYCNELTKTGLNAHNQSILESLLNQLAPEIPVYILKGEEKGADIHFLQNELTNHGFKVHFVQPDQIQMLAELSTHSQMNVVFELHQHEIMQQNNIEMLTELSLQSHCFNDLRSVFIAHDKRLLSIIHNDSLISDFCDSSDLSFLKAHVAQTFLPKSNSKIVAEALNNQNEWLLKPNLFGKGEGIVIGKNIDKSIWKATLESSTQSDYVLQRFVEQKTFPVPCLDAHTGELTRQQMNIVGTMLCLNNEFLGPGIYRASSSDIINVSRGGSILAPLY